MIGTDVARVPGVPETVLGEALLATLPENAAPAPWSVRGSAVLWLGRGGGAARQVLPSGLRGRALAVVGGFVRYSDTPVGPYDEVFGIVLARAGRRVRAHVAFMAVDSATSLVGGRANWAMPKTLAAFSGGPAERWTAEGTDDRGWRVSAVAKPLAPAVPPVPLRARASARQQFPDGSTPDARLSLAAGMRPALVDVEVTSEHTLPRWLRPGRHLGAVLPEMRFTLAAPR